MQLGTTLNFGATTTLSDYSGATGSAGQILTINAAGTGVEWGTLPTASTPTIQRSLQQVILPLELELALLGRAPSFDNQTSHLLEQILLQATINFPLQVQQQYRCSLFTGTLHDGSGVGSAGQVLTSTGTGVMGK